MANIPTTKVILCTCQGLLSARLPLDDISQFLKEIAPGTEVAFNNDLCQGKFGNNLRPQLGSGHPRVFGACAKLNLGSCLRRGSSNISDLSYPEYVVDLLSSTDSASENKVNIERLKLLLLAKIKRINAFNGIRPDNLKVHFSLPRDVVTRRQLLTAALPKYELVPCIEKYKCRGEHKCGLCVNICPRNAISTQEDNVVVDSNKCTGCGTCVAFCPFAAIYYPTFSLEELDAELEGLLVNNNVHLEPRIIAFICENCLSKTIENNNSCITFPDNILPVYTPCLAMVSSWLILRAFDMGSHGVVLLADKNECWFGCEPASWENNIEFIRNLFNGWGIQSERVELVKTSKDNLSELSNILSRFREKITGMTITPFKSSNPTVISVNGLRETELIQCMDRKVQYISSATISADNVRFGKLKLDNMLCTGCGLCAVNCPTDALVADMGGHGDFELFFKQNLCIGCGKCVTICPEKCLQLQCILELDRINAGAYKLYTDDILTCRICGEYVAPISMIDRLKTKLQNMDGALIGQIELCNRCKTESQTFRLTKHMERLSVDDDIKTAIQGVYSRGDK